MGAYDSSGTFVTMDEGSYNTLREVVRRERYPRRMSIDELLGDAHPDPIVRALDRWIGFRFRGREGHERGAMLRYEIKARKADAWKIARLYNQIRRQGDAVMPIHSKAVYRLNVVIDLNDGSGVEVLNPAEANVYVPHSTLMRTGFNLVETVRRTIGGR